MKLSEWRNLAFVILLSFLPSCAKVTVKNTEWCGDLGEYGASCFNTLDDDERDIPKKEWDEIRYGMLCTKAEYYSDWKSTIEKLCKLAKSRCTYDDKKKVFIFSQKIERFIEKAQNFDNPIQN